jgi:hypothetical protein
VSESSHKFFSSATAIEVARDTEQQTVELAMNIAKQNPLGCVVAGSEQSGPIANAPSTPWRWGLAIF